jgi:Domain of unknown function (DUF202)
MSPPVQRSDSGLARERTALAWNRSGLAAVVCIAVLLRHIWPLHSTAQDVALGLIAAAGIIWALVLLAVVTSGGDQEGNLLLGRRVFSLMTAGTLLLALIGFGLAFFAPS